MLAVSPVSKFRVVSSLILAVIGTTDGSKRAFHVLGQFVRAITNGVLSGQVEGVCFQIGRRRLFQRDS